MDKARVQVGPAVRIRTIRHVPEGVDPVRVVEMGVQAKKLAKARLHITKETLWEAGVLTDPITTGESRQRSIQSSRRHSDWGAGIRSIEASGSIGTRASSPRDIVNWESFDITQLSYNPALN